jgi:Condensation domain
MTGRLTFVEEIVVPFSGARSGEGPVTLGQRTTLHWTNNMTQNRGRMFPALVDLVGTTVADVCAALALLLARHESLRTTFLVNGAQIQRVWPSGELTVAVHEIDEDTEQSRLAAYGQLAPAMRELGFELAKDLPVRVCVVTLRGEVRFAILMFSHMAVDFAAMAIVVRQLAELAAHPADRVLGEPAHQPLDQAAEEQSPRGLRRAEAALRYWERQRWRIPQCLYAVPPSAPDAEQVPPAGTLVSRAAALAVPHITARTGSTPPQVVLAALTTVLARRTGQRLAPIHALADNRIGRQMHAYVGTVAQDGLVVVDTDSPSFDEVIARTGAAMLNGSRYSLVDTVAAYHTRERIDRVRGIQLGRDCEFNNTSQHSLTRVQGPQRGTLAEVRAALADTELTWSEVIIRPALLSMQLTQLDERLELMLLSGDPQRVPAAEIEMLARGTEALLVAAAAGDVDLATVGTVTGVEPVPRGDRWCYVDSCWVNLDEVQRLLDEALPDHTSAVFAAERPGGTGSAEGEPLVLAYLAGAGDITPERAHDACMAALPGRITAMAPGYYVVCDRAPEDGSRAGAWQRQRVLAEGDGRAD